MSGCRHTLISDGFFRRLLSKLSYSSENWVSKVILTAESDKLSLETLIRLKNQKPVIFLKAGFSSDIVLVAIIVISDPKLVVSQVLSVNRVP